MSSDEVIVITGGAGGMGLASARLLASDGPLLLVDLSEEELGAASTTLRSEGARVDVLRCDVTVPDAILPLARQGSSAVLIGSIAGYSDVDPTVEALLDE
jgi:NAD(P)-dependent dehydrogenase (short-subunit alcohol dehydrogenase family)